MSKKNANQLKMYLPDFRASIRIANFVKIKYSTLSSIIQKPESLYLLYTIDQFLSLLKNIFDVPGISGLRVYFATYLFLKEDTSNNNSLIPPGCENNLTLIYAPTTDIGGVPTDTGDYFIMEPGGTIVNLKGTTIPQAWVDHFYHEKYPPLNEIVQHIQGSTQQNETRSIFYELASLAELYDFLKKQTDIPEVAIFFGAYHLPNHEIENGAFSGSLSELVAKLTLVLGFMEKYGQYYFYENILENDNDKRDPFDGSASVDTGVPCPPPNPPSKCGGASL